MQWFKHDSNATSDAKIKKLILRYGAEGYGIYFHCIELIVSDVSESNITFELEHDSEIIADNLKIKGTQEVSAIDRVNEVMRYIVSLGLFEESQGRIHCYKILKRLDSSMTSNPRMRKIITNGGDNHDAVMTDHDSVMLEQNRIDKKRREEKKEPPTSPPDATAFEMASLVASLHQQLDAKYQPTKSQLETWARDIERLHRLDGRDWSEIEQVIRWAKTAGNFWQPNIISGAKLRKQFPTIYAQMQRPLKGLPVHTRTAFLDMED